MGAWRPRHQGVRRSGREPLRYLVVHLGVDTVGVRRVNEIVAVPGRVENDVIETETIFERHGPDLRRMSGIPPRPERYEQVGIDVRRLLNGAA